MLKYIRKSPVSEEIAQNLQQAEKNGNTMRINTFAYFLEKVVSECHHFCESSWVGTAIKEHILLLVGQVQQNKLWCEGVKGEVGEFFFSVSYNPWAYKGCSFLNFLNTNMCVNVQ